MGLSERLACTLASAYRIIIRYHSRRVHDTALRKQIRVLANERKPIGFRGLFILFRRDGEPSGINRIYLLCREEGLTVRNRRAVGTRATIMVEPTANARWSLDFVHYQFAYGAEFAF
jgi:putative transposase